MAMKDALVAMKDALVAMKVRFMPHITNINYIACCCVIASNLLRWHHGHCRVQIVHDQRRVPAAPLFVNCSKLRHQRVTITITILLHFNTLLMSSNARSRPHDTASLLRRDAARWDHGGSGEVSEY